MTAVKRLVSGVLHTEEAENMKVLAWLIIIALLYAYLAVKTKAFLEGTVCDFEFMRHGCDFLSWIGAK